jgi:hypothetical protein
MELFGIDHLMCFPDNLLAKDNIECILWVMSAGILIVFLNSRCHGNDVLISKVLFVLNAAISLRNTMK